mmetsp:Transcript_16417/g.40086  ORF Transcript_16417/g.40086 Transcript_16417/m.40086 type:complete len:109 (+) Transcript_16417:830-1156(+)
MTRSTRNVSDQNQMDCFRCCSNSPTSPKHSCRQTILEFICKRVVLFDLVSEIPPRNLEPSFKVSQIQFRLRMQRKSTFSYIFDAPAEYMIWSRRIRKRTQPNGFHCQA